MFDAITGFLWAMLIHDVVALLGLIAVVCGGAFVVWIAEAIIRIRRAYSDDAGR